MSRKRVDLLAPPFSGHLHPILGIGRALADGFEVRVLSTAGAQEEIRQAGLRAVTLLGGLDGDLRSIVNPQYAVGSHPARLHRQFRRTLGVLRQAREDLRELYEHDRPDLLIADFTLPVAGVVAAELEIPWWTSHPSPCVVETPDGPPAYLGGMTPGKAWSNRARNAAGRVGVRAFKRLTFAIYAREIRRAGVTRLYRPDGTECVYSPERVLALGMREMEFPRRWPPSITFTGPVLYTPPGAHPEPPFVEGKQHILVTLGTHLDWLKELAAAEVVQAARRMPSVVFHFSEGRPAGGGAETMRENFARLPYVAYDPFLSRYDLVVHHGGAGVMYHCLRRGKPAVVYPVDYDQFDHAARLEEAGAALRMRRLDRLETAVEQALGSAALARRCAELAEVLAGYRTEERIRGLAATLFR